MPNLTPQPTKDWRQRESRISWMRLRASTRIAASHLGRKLDCPFAIAKAQEEDQVHVWLQRSWEWIDHEGNIRHEQYLDWRGI
eukprot:5787322-Prymnesium_polylepis.1